MTLYPKAVWQPVRNHSGVLSEHRGLVVHVQVGTGSCYAEFNNPSSQASSTWQAMKDGTVLQFVDADYIAWTEAAGNPYYDSVETEGFPADPLTDAQCEALAELIAWGHKMFGWPLTLVDHGSAGVTTHAHYPSGTPDPAWGDHPCPGSVRAAQLPGIVRVAHQLVYPQPPPPPPAPKEHAMIAVEFNSQVHTFTVEPNGSLVHRWQQSGQPTWGKDIVVAAGLVYPQTPAVDTVHNGNLNVWADRTDGTQEHCWQPAGGPWAQPETVA